MASTTTNISHQGPDPYMEEDIDQAYDSELDILSLCDLPIYSSQCSSDHDQDYNSQELRDNSLESFDSSFSEDQENFFEFFSEEWNISTKTKTASSKFMCSPSFEENIIFCGKVISSKQTLPNEFETLKLNTTKNVTPQENTQEKKTSLIPWKPNSIYFRSKSKSSSGKKGVDLTPKVEIYTAPVKSKLLLVLFGLPPKFPADQTELMTDIRNRQSRRAPSTFVSNSGGYSGEDVVVRRRSSENGLWRFIKAATCFSGQPRENDVF